MIESEVKALAANAKSISETYPAINHALKLIKTNHSFLTRPNGEVIVYYSELNCNAQFDVVDPQLDDIGFIKVLGSYFQTPTEEKKFAEDLQKSIANQDDPDIQGWIVDLRDNTGGNMYPMVAGIGPLIGEGVHGYFFDADDNTIPWGYRNGSSYIGTSNVETVDTPYTLQNQTPKIAVLTNKSVASSGEAVLISFKGLPNVRFFGTDSCGLSTGNVPHNLSDGSILLLAQSIMADRDFNKYGGRVSVDQEVTNDSQVVDAAVKWIRNEE